MKKHDKSMHKGLCQHFFSLEELWIRIRAKSQDLTGSETPGGGKGPRPVKRMGPQKTGGPAGARTNSPENYAKHASKSASRAA